MPLCDLDMQTRAWVRRLAISILFLLPVTGLDFDLHMLNKSQKKNIFYDRAEESHSLRKEAAL